MNPSSRSRQIRQIKAAGAALLDGDEQAQRDLYEKLTGVRSCTAMTDAQLRQVGDYLARATGHKPDKRVAFRASSSVDLAERLREFERREAPPGWKMNPLRTRMLWKRCTGSDSAVPFEHLTSAQQSRLFRAVKAIYDGSQSATRRSPATSFPAAKIADDIPI